MLKHTKTVPGEYNFKGHISHVIQYKVSKDDIANMDVSNQDSDDRGFKLDFHTEENKRRLTPDTKCGNATNWRLILVMRSERENGEIWLKGALENQLTGEIALITSTNTESAVPSRGTTTPRSHEPGWFIGFYGMSAPMIFWRELVNRVRN